MYMQTWRTCKYLFSFTWRRASGGTVSFYLISLAYSSSYEQCGQSSMHDRNTDAESNNEMDSFFPLILGTRSAKGARDANESS